MSQPVNISVPKDLNVKISRDKVVVQDRRKIEVSKDNCRIIINVDNLDDFRHSGWKTFEDLKKDAEAKIESAKQAQI
jgi:hypothetical protein